MNHYFEEHLRMSTCQLYLKRDPNIDVFVWILWIIQEHLFLKKKKKKEKIVKKKNTYFKEYL